MTTGPNMDEAAFASFYESTKQGLWLYIMKVVRDESVTDDIFQESYIRFLQRPSREKEERSMKSYLYRIATNLTNDHWRRLKRDRKWFAGDAVSDGAEVPAANGTGQVEERHDIADTLGHLAPQQRSMVWLAYVEEYTHREIAEMLKLKESSVKVLLHRAKRKLLEIFKHKGMTSEATP